MEIIDIYPPYLYAVQYDGESRNEFHRLFHEWNDKEFLLSFFREHIDFLDKDIWVDLENNPEKAAFSVAFDANRLEHFLEELADNAGKGIEPDFDNYFQPLDGKYLYSMEKIPVKGYGKNNHTFIRLYAIKIEQNCYLIVYGGLKLAKTIQESPVLKDHVFAKIDWVLQYLKREGIVDNEDLQKRRKLWDLI